MFNSKRKRSKRSPPGSTRSVLTFSNPNYNGADGGGAGPSEPKMRLWKRLKYDKAQVGSNLQHWSTKLFVLLVVILETRVSIQR